MPVKYVMGLDETGKAEVLTEQDISSLPEVGPGLLAMDLWVNRETPANLSSREDPTAGKSFTHEPPDGGALFRVIDFQAGQRRSVESMQALHAAIGSVHVPSDNEFTQVKDPTMHKTDTLNYFCLLYGELWALSEGRDVLLRPGDVMIQKGCMHGWRNTGTQVARLMCVLIDARPA